MNLREIEREPLAHGFVDMSDGLVLLSMVERNRLVAVARAALRYRDLAKTGPWPARAEPLFRALDGVTDEEVGDE